MPSAASSSASPANALEEQHIEARLRDGFASRAPSSCSGHRSAPSASAARTRSRMPAGDRLRLGVRAKEKRDVGERERSPPDVDGGIRVVVQAALVHVVRRSRRSRRRAATLEFDVRGVVRDAELDSLAEWDRSSGSSASRSSRSRPRRAEVRSLLRPRVNTRPRRSRVPIVEKKSDDTGRTSAIIRLSGAAPADDLRCRTRRACCDSRADALNATATDCVPGSDDKPALHVGGEATNVAIEPVLLVG